MSYPLDSDVQEDVRTFPMYQRLRKINPYAYYSLNTQKQMQSDLRNFGSLTFFEQNIDDIPEVPEPTHSIELPKALADAEHMLDTGSPEFNEKAVRRMRTRIRLLAQPESMRSIVGATQQEQRFD